MFEAICGFMKWKYPNNQVLELESKTKKVHSLLHVKGQIKSKELGNSHILHIQSPIPKRGCHV